MNFDIEQKFMYFCYQAYEADIITDDVFVAEPFMVATYGWSLCQDHETPKISWKSPTFVDTRFMLRVSSNRVVPRTQWG